MKRMLVIIWSMVLIYAVYTFLNYRMESSKNKIMYEEIKNIDIASSKQQYINDPESLKEPLKEELKRPLLDRYKTLKANNEEFQGWIKITNTHIDYPVFRSKDNYFYLEHDMYKKANKAGSIFMDFRNEGSLSDKNIILYGHNMMDGSMFAGLMKYRESDFLSNNPIIEFSNLYEDMKWEVFSVYVTDTNFDYIKTDFTDKKEYADFLKVIKQKSQFRTDVEVTEEDSILTLSTCSYEFNNARLVVHAKRNL